MRVFGLWFVIVAASALPAFGAVGDQWILGIHHIDNAGTFTTYSGAGYSALLPHSSGHQDFKGNAYGRGGTNGVARVYWELSGNSIGTNRPVPTTTEQYTIEFFGTSAPSNNDWQPIESQFKAVNGETWPMEPLIPWNGAFGSNHQYIAAAAKTPGQWMPTGPGPHTPASASAAAGPNGLYMWLTTGSWLYAKWDFVVDDGSLDRSWSAIRLTQVTGDAPPAPPEGDYNQDGKVDAADYIVWRKGLDQADGIDDDIIDEYDYFFWLENFGEPPAEAGSVQVPEPASIALTLIGLLGITSALRRRVGR